MPLIHTQCRALISGALHELFPQVSPEQIAEALILETPPSPDMGDIGVPMFPLAKLCRTAPPVIAAKAAESLAENPAARDTGEFFCQGPYLNLRLNRPRAAYGILHTIQTQGDRYGSLGDDGAPPLKGRRVMVEFSGPNTNKPLHLGHLRNDAIGESVSRILACAGAEVRKVNIINNRGVHICKTMLAYQKFHEQRGDTPASLGVKSDRFVGDCYVEYNGYAQDHPEAEAEAQNLLVLWEQGDPAVRKLWDQMNRWATEGIFETYRRTGVSFDAFYYESDTYLKGRDEVLKGLHGGVFYREADGSVWVNLEEIGLDKKVLLRKDGTALYITQDLGTAVFRHDDWPFDRLVYVVGSEQQYHFKVLFYCLKKLGYPWAHNLYHLSYGMVNLPEGKMKSREGTVVDGDDLLDSLKALALEEIREKGREDALGDPDAVAEAVALGALHYFLLQQSPAKDMLFDPRESLSFTGNTGPYLQYMGARLSSILKKAAESGVVSDPSPEAAALLLRDEEWALIKLLGDFPAVILRAAEALDPSLLAGHVYETAKAFGRFYHECPIVGAESAALAGSRLHLAICTLTVLRKGMGLLLAPFLESM
ncbi:MAG: arginine--tRNA ligase [Spirochaetaceae bacterium]|jgi:arginyl-tRNA synthetase|nr:arginine--tRNA ligase [Spirochaetaceae bacterium]